MRERSREPAVVEDLGIGLTFRTDRRAGCVTRAEQRRGSFDLAARRRKTGEGIETDGDTVWLAKLAGKSVAVVTGTTSQTALKGYLERNLIDAKVVPVSNRDEAVKQLQGKRVDAFASDQIVLIGLLMQAPDPGVYKLVHDVFSYEPYALVVRRNDADFRLAADRALAQLYRTGQIDEVYAQWFSRAGLRPSPMLTAVYTLGALPE
jgi:ABC-type amino acid transport substrate-binding protein